MVVLRTSVPVAGEDRGGGVTVAAFTVEASETVPFVLAETEAFWTDWAAGCREAGPYMGAVRRSLVTLKALTYAPTGGIVAAATTSLPETLGGARDWDYRF